MLRTSTLFNIPPVRKEAKPKPEKPTVPEKVRKKNKRMYNASYRLRNKIGEAAFPKKSKNIFCEIFFRTKKKQKKKTGSADSHRRTRETIRGATEKRAFSLLFFFCFSIDSIERFFPFRELAILSLVS